MTKTHKLRVIDNGDFISGGKTMKDWRVEHHIDGDFEDHYEAPSKAAAVRLKDEKEKFFLHHGHNVI